MTNLLSILLPLLIIVESGGDGSRVGKHGELGVIQITPICVRDVNRISGTQYIHVDARDRRKAVNMYWVYMTHYMPTRYTGKISEARYLEIAARIWNCGPDGHSQPESLPYWDKVRKLLIKGGHIIGENDGLN